MNLYKRIRIWYSVIKTFILTFNGVDGYIYSAEDTVAELLKKRGLIRFGDGEFGIYRGKDIHYQRWSQELKEAFEKIKRDYEREAQHSPYLLAVPQKFMTVSGFRLIKKRVYVSSWSESRYDFKKNFRHDIPYGDAFLFEKDNKDIYSKIWRNDTCPEHVIFVHNSEKYAKLFADTFEKAVTFIACPSKDAFEVVDELEQKIQGIIKKNKWNADDFIVTISAGPAGKVLVYRLSKCGFWCIDAGHCWDEPLEGIE